jgi:hypothetical protein
VDVNEEGQDADTESPAPSAQRPAPTTNDTRHTTHCVCQVLCAANPHSNTRTASTSGCSAGHGQPCACLGNKYGMGSPRGLCSAGLLGLTSSDVSTTVCTYGLMSTTRPRRLASLAALPSSPDPNPNQQGHTATSNSLPCTGTFRNGDKQGWCRRGCWRDCPAAPRHTVPQELYRAGRGRGGASLT